MSRKNKTLSLQDFNAKFQDPSSRHDSRPALPSAPMGLPTGFEQGDRYNQSSRGGYNDDQSGRADSSSSWRGSRGPSQRGPPGGMRGPPRGGDGGFSRGGAGDGEERGDPDFGRADGASNWRRADRVPSRQPSRGNSMRSSGPPRDMSAGGGDRSFGSSDARFAASTTAQSRYGDDGPPDFRSGGARPPITRGQSSRSEMAAAPGPEQGSTRFGANSQHPSDSGARRIHRQASGRFKDVVEEHASARDAPAPERGVGAGLRDRSNIPKGSSRFADLGGAASGPLPAKAAQTPVVASGRFARTELEKPAAAADTPLKAATGPVEPQEAPRPVRSTPANPATASKNPFGAARTAQPVSLPPLKSTKRPTPSGVRKPAQDARKVAMDDAASATVTPASPGGADNVPKDQQQMIFKLRTEVKDPLAGFVTADELAAGLSPEAPPVAWEAEGADKPAWDVAALLRTSVLKETIKLSEIDAVFAESASQASRGPAVLLATAKYLQSALGDAKFLALLEEQNVELDWLRGRLVEAASDPAAADVADFLTSQGLVALVPATANVVELVSSVLQSDKDDAAKRAAVLSALQTHVVSAELLDAAAVQAVAEHVFVAWANAEAGAKRALLEAWKPVVHAAAPPSHETAQVQLLLASHTALMAAWRKKFDKKTYKALAQELLDTGIVPANSFVAWKHDMSLTSSDKAAKASKMKAILAIGTWVDELDVSFVDPEEEVLSSDEGDEEEVDPDDDELEQLGLGRPLNSEQ